MAPQLIDPVPLEQGPKFLHAYPLIQEASLASKGTFYHPDQVFPLTSSLYGIQITDHQLRQATKIALAPEKLRQEPRPQTSRMSQEQAPEASQLSQLTSNLAQVNRTNMTPSNPLQTSLSPQLASTSVPPHLPGEETHLEAPSSDEQPASLSIAHVKPSILKRKVSFPKYYACHLCGRRFPLRSSPFKCSTCDKSFCRANQAAWHVCLYQSIDTYTMVGKQTLELCTFEEGSRMDNMLVQTN
ncbi:Zinc finger and BTB domain-containing protein 2 [Sciurus carolinensis]|uniref:Zinc finger and BTB domain-containing protein 2 n=1 Tax=Sciurus carolinensis TaxID=30640 RepID=A0AA41MEX8_SCICA|nr:Zinc finger and BTB domain-containing protein 2 [Sciurus carolinensis]